MTNLRSLAILISAAILLIFPVYTGAETIDGRQILKQCSEALSKIHTAEYNIEKRYYQSPTDSFTIRVQKYHTLECENPTDSVGLAMWINTESDGSFLSGFDGKNRYFASGDRYTVSRPYDMWGARRLSPPFFNHAASLCNYLSAPDDKTEISCTDAGDHWIIDAQTKGKELIVFHGKKYTLPIAQNVTSQFRLRIDKNTLLPDMLSYLNGNPPIRYDEYCTNVKLNPCAPATFSIADYTVGLKETDSDANIDIERKQINAHIKNLTFKPAPTDMLQTTDGKNFSLTSTRGKVTFVLLTSTCCRACLYAYPSINRFAETYSGKGVEFVAVVYDSEAEMPAIAQIKEKHQIPYTVAQNNKSFYEYFLPNGLSPAVAVIDREGLVSAIHIGFNSMDPEKTEKKYRAILDKALDPATSEE